MIPCRDKARPPNLIAMASNLTAMASNLRAMASNLIAMAMASTLRAMASNGDRELFGPSYCKSVREHLKQVLLQWSFAVLQRLSSIVPVQIPFTCCKSPQLFFLTMSFSSRGVFIF